MAMTAAGMRSWASPLRALRSRNYRLFFSGQIISLIGTWMTRVATSWLVYRLTGSAMLLGLVGFADRIPFFLLTPLAGVWIDRWDRRRTLVVTQVVSMLQSLSLAALALSGTIAVWHIACLALLQGVISAFDMPARQAFVVEMVEKREDLGNAIALNSSMVHSSRMVGPAIAGLIIAAAGEGYCFLLDGASYLAVIASLAAMKIAARPPRAPRRHMLHELQEGWRYVSGSVPIRSILLLLAVVSLTALPYTVLMPVFAAGVLHGGAHALGFLMAASGLGAVTGAVTLAMRRTVLGLDRRIALAPLLFGAALIAFGLSRSLWLSLLVLPAAGFGMIQQLASSNTILQTIVHEEKRGRVMAYYSLSFQGMAPFGSLLAGGLASTIGAPGTVIVGGIVSIAASLWFSRQLPAIRALVRPIYRQLGILPELAMGVQNASSLQTPPEE